MIDSPYVLYLCRYLLDEIMRDSVLVILPIGASLSRNMSMLSISSSVVGVTTPGCSWKSTPPPENESVVHFSLDVEYTLRSESAVHNSLSDH